MYAFTGPAYFTSTWGTYTWQGGSGSWSTSGNSNWSISTTGSPLAGSWANGEYQAVFNNVGGTVTLDNYTSAHGLTIQSGATGYTFTGGSLILTNSGIVANESVSINSPLTIGAPQTWTVAAGKQLTVGGSVDLNINPLVVAGGGNTVINGVIGDVRNDPILGSAWTGQVGTLTMAGSGTLILGAANTYSGNTLISSGTLQLAHPLALQNSTLDTSGSGCLSFGGQTAATLGGLLGPGSLSLTNTASAAVALTVGADNASTTYSGGLSGGGASLIKTGTGTLAVSGSNTYDGGTTVNSGDPELHCRVGTAGRRNHYGRQQRLCGDGVQRHGGRLLGADQQDHHVGRPRLRDAAVRDAVGGHRSDGLQRQRAAWGREHRQPSAATTSSRRPATPIASAAAAAP